MRLRPVMLSAAAVVGLIGAHLIDYALLIPDPEHRHDILMRTGHGYLQFGLAVGAVAAIAALASALALGARGHARAARPGAVMGLVQAGGFVALEAVERLGAGARFDRSVIGVLVLGVALQFVVASVAARVLGLVARLGEAIGRALGVRAPVFRAAPRVVGAASSQPVPDARRVEAYGLRGPPVRFA
jgi:hypothetical protein